VRNQSSQRRVDRIAKYRELVVHARLGQIACEPGSCPRSTWVESCASGIGKSVAEPIPTTLIVVNICATDSAGRDPGSRHDGKRRFAFVTMRQAR
jgi:hypothetical protein